MEDENQALLRYISEVAGHLMCQNGQTVAQNCETISNALRDSAGGFAEDFINAKLEEAKRFQEERREQQEKELERQRMERIFRSRRPDEASFERGEQAGQAAHGSLTAALGDQATEAEDASTAIPSHQVGSAQGSDPEAPTYRDDVQGGASDDEGEES